MTHETCRELLLDLAYGELSPRDAADVERHVGACPDCRAERDRMAATLGAMRRLPPPPPPPEDRVVAAAARAMAQEQREQRPLAGLGAFSWRVAAGTAIALVVAGVSLKLIGPRRTGDDLAPQEWTATKGGRAETKVGRDTAPRERAEPAFAEPERPAPGPGTAPPPASPAPPRRAAPSRPTAKSAPAPEPEPEARAAPRPLANAEAPRQGALRREESGGPPAAAPPIAVGAAPSAAGEARSLSAPPQRKQASRAPAPAPAADAPTGPAARARDALGVAMSDVALAIERRRAAGELQEAVKRFAPCPGGDVRRTALVDDDRVLKLTREKADGTVVEEWFDRGGRLREALVRGRAGDAPFARRIVVDAEGRTTLDATSPEGAAAGAALPALDRADPSGAFFAGPGCAR